MNREIELLKHILFELDSDRDNYQYLCLEIEELLAKQKQIDDVQQYSA